MDKEQVLKLTNAICKNTLMETLEIEFTDVGEDFLTARMPVTKKCINLTESFTEEQQLLWLRALEVQQFLF